jgi:nucleoside transporter
MSGASTAPALSAGLNARLSAMMFLQYAIWGAWLPFLWSFLADHRRMDGETIGNMFAVGAVGAIIGPFLAGQVADRYLSTERVLGVSHLVGALLIWQLAWIEEPWMFLAFSLVYGLVYAPTLSLTNSLAFHHLPDRDRDFGRVRTWGTFGWILVGLMMGHWLALRHTPAGEPDDVVRAAQVAGKADAFRLSGLLGAAMGLYAFTLPHTPPMKGARSNATFEALRYVKAQPLLTLFLLAVPVSCIHQFYFVHTEAFLGDMQLDAPGFFQKLFGAGGGGLMTIGQMSEVLVLLGIPLVAKKASRKLLLGVGLVAYAARMFLFAYVERLGLPVMPTLLTGVAMHGLCFGCFVFVAFMVVDEESPADVRASAQSLFNLVIIGIGVIVGSKIAGWVADWAIRADGSRDYTRLFAVPMWAALACLVALIAAYPAGSRASSNRGRALA